MARSFLEAQMFTKDDKIWVLGFLVPFMVIHVILYLFGYKGQGMGDPINKWIALVLYIGISLFIWEKKEFIKRCILALPFALLIVLLLRFTLFGLSGSCVFGILMFVLLTIETKNLKGSFAIKLIVGIILISLMVIFVTLANSIRAP